MGKKEIIKKIREKVAIVNNLEFNKILYLPLTIEWILSAILVANEKRLKNDKNILKEVAEYHDLDSINKIEDWMFYDTFDTFPFVEFQFAFQNWHISTGESQGVINWRLNKTLEDQDKETINDIYNILYDNRN